MITQAPRGTKDWFGKDMDQRTYLENIFKDLSPFILSLT